MQNLENIIRTTAIEWYDLQKDRLCLYIKQSSRLLWSIFSTICTYKLKSSEGSTLFLAQICQLWPKNSLYLNPIVQNTQYFFKIAMCRQARGLEIQMWPQNKQILRSINNNQICFIKAPGHWVKEYKIQHACLHCIPFSENQVLKDKFELKNG